MKNIGNLFVRLFVVSLLAFRYFSTIITIPQIHTFPQYPYSEPEPPRFYGSGSGSEQTVSAAPAPAPAKMCRLRRLRLRIPGNNVH